MPSPLADRTTVTLLAALGVREELPEAVRARIALDLLASLPGDEASVDGRSGQSRLHLGAVRVPPSGRAYLVGTGDATGAGVLIWEVFAGRESPPDERPRLHDVVDEVHADVDDVVNASLDGGYRTVAELLDALTLAAPRAASHFDVVAALRDPEAPLVSRRPSVPWPRPASVAPPAALQADAFDDLELATHRAASEPDIQLVLLCTNDDDDPLAAELRRAGLLVWAQAPGADGAEVVALAHPRVVVCDAEIEGTYDFIEALRGHDATRDTPLVVLAPRVEDRSSLAAFYATADVFLEKPCEAAAVAKAVVDLVEKRARIAPSLGKGAMRGDLAHVAASTIFEILDLERRSGELRVDASGWRVVIELTAGHVVRVTIDGKEAAARAALAAILREKSGSFAFTPTGARAMPPKADRLATLLVGLAEQDETDPKNSGRLNEHERPSATRSPE
jgi:CheY-like chemotaxis protein